MANIPVERTSTGTPWWLWLLGLLLLALLAWFLISALSDDDDDVAVVDDTEVVDVAPAPVVAEPVTTEDQLYAVDGGEMEGVTVTRLEPGTPVTLRDIQVLRVNGDSTFWIGRDDGRRYLVVLSNLGEDETGAGGSDGVFDVDDGDTVSITGAIARYVDGERGLSELTDADTEALRERQAYIRVNSRDDITVGG